MPWLPFAIAAPALYGITNFFDKYLIEKRVRQPVFLAILGGFASATFGFIIWIIRGFPAPPATAVLTLFISGILFEWALLPYFAALRHEDTSRITPLFQMIPVLTLILSAIFLGETLRGNQVSGFAIVLAGGIALAIEKFEWSLFALRRSFWLILFSSLLFTIPLVLFKSVAVTMPFWDALTFEFFGAGAGSLLLLGVKGYRRRFTSGLAEVRGTTWAIMGVNEILYIAARSCTFFASTLAPLALVTVVGSFQPLFVLLLGIGLTLWFPRVIREDIRRHTLVAKAIATVVILVGVIIMQR